MIAWSNKIAVDAKLEAGSTINVPMSPGFVYTIKSGDSVEKLAAKYSTTANDIIEANDLAGVSIAEGMVILIANGTYIE
jgi:LysM repeat protein